MFGYVKGIVCEAVKGSLIEWWYRYKKVSLKWYYWLCWYYFMV